MRHQSTQHRRRAAEAKPVRMQFIVEVDRCELCGRHRFSGRYRTPLFVHEIARGFARQAALDQRCAILCLCGTCHDRIHNETGWTYARQLSLLRKSRPADFDLAAFCRLIRRAPGAITEEEVNEWL